MKVTVSKISVSDGASSVYGRLYSPQDTAESGQPGTLVYPAIIMSHGYNGSNEDFARECLFFAENGYIACAIDFCGGSNSSKSSGLSTDMTIFTEKSNLLAVFRYIQSLPNVDKERIFLHGGSQGGLVTALTTEEVADDVRGLILYYPAFNIPDDWRAMHPDADKIPEVIDFWELKLGKVFAESIRDFKPFEHIGSYSKNVLLFYGARDAIVKRSYMDRVKNSYRHCDLIIYPEEEHGFTPATAIKAREEILSFMERQK